MKKYGLFILSFLIGLLLSFFAYRISRDLEYRKIENYFLLSAEERTLAISASLDKNIDILEAIRSFYYSSDKITRSEFSTFTQPLLKKTTGIQVVSWIPHVFLNQRFEYEQQARTDGFTEFSIRERSESGMLIPAASRKDYYPVYFLEPLKGNESAVGFDLASNFDRLNALEKAKKTGENVATSRIVLVQETGESFGVIGFLPLFFDGHSTGFISGAFRVADIVEEALKPLQSMPINIYLNDKTADKDREFLYLHQNGSLKEKNRGDLYTYSKRLSFASREWEVVCEMTPEFVRTQQTWHTFGVLFFCIVITFFMSFILFKNIHLTDSIRQEVIFRTRELQASEEKLSAILSGITDFILLIDKDRQVVWANDPAKKFFGEEILNQACSNCSQVNAPGHSCLGRLTLQKQKNHQSEIELFKDGERYIYWVTSNILNEENEDSGIIEIFRDITVRKKAAEEIAKTIEIKNEFSSMVSHELRTPLTAIKESLALVIEEKCGPLNEEQIDYLNMSIRNIERLSRLINDVLYYQKLDAEKVIYKKEINDISSTIREVEKTMHPLIRKGKLTLLTDLQEILLPQSFDKDKIIQVLMNLLNNAIKFTESGSITISTSISDGFVVITVSDTGIGIKPEYLEEIFKSFSQIAQACNRETGSSGLGLAICQKIILQHEGKIWAESEYGKGTRFSFTLPL